MPAANEATAPDSSEQLDERVANISKARAEYERRSALRAVENPAKLARARRIVCAAIELEQLTVEELLEGVPTP